MVDPDGVTVRCDVCHEALEGEHSIMLGKWIFCEACLVEIGTQIQTVLERKRALCRDPKTTTA